MAWYLDGEWKDENSGAVKSILANFCCAVNEREVAVGEPATAFSVGTFPAASGFVDMPIGSTCKDISDDIISKLTAVQSHYKINYPGYPLSYLPSSYTGHTRWQEWDWLDYIRKYISAYRYTNEMTETVESCGYYHSHFRRYHAEVVMGPILGYNPLIDSYTEAPITPPPASFPYTISRIQYAATLYAWAKGSPDSIELSLDFEATSFTIPEQLPLVSSVELNTGSPNPWILLGDTGWPRTAPTISIGGIGAMSNASLPLMGHYDWSYWGISASCAYAVWHEIPSGDIVDLNPTFTYPAITPY